MHFPVAFAHKWAGRGVHLCKILFIEVRKAYGLEARSAAYRAGVGLGGRGACPWVQLRPI